MPGVSKNTYVGTGAQEKQACDNDQNVYNETNPAANTANGIEARAVFGAAHAEVRHTPENPSEEGIKERAHERQQIREERNDLSDNEGKDPEHSENCSPGRPAHHRVARQVLRALEQTEHDKTTRHRGVQHT